jgi:hypothetical protein
MCLLDMLVPGNLFVACGALVGRGVLWFCCHPFAVQGWVHCSWWGHRIGRVWQMYYAIWVWVWD